MAATGGRGGGDAKIAVAEQRYAGWLDVLRTVSGALDLYRTESVVDFGCGWTELQQFAWSRPLESIWHTGERCYFLSIALDGTMDTNRSNVEHPSAVARDGGRVLLVPPGQTIRSLSPVSGRRRTMRCLIDADFVEAICSERPSQEERSRLGAIDLGGGPIEWLMLRMFREMDAAQAGAAIAVESLARQIAVEIARDIERGRRRIGRHEGGLTAWRMRLLMDRIYADAPLPTARELAPVVGLTVRHLARAFRKETGRSIGKFIDSVMAERATIMLEAAVPAGSVAAALGYASSSSFAQAFHRETGLLPSAILRRRASRSGRNDDGRVG